MYESLFKTFSFVYFRRKEKIHLDSICFFQHRGYFTIRVCAYDHLNVTKLSSLQTFLAAIHLEVLQKIGWKGGKVDELSALKFITNVFFKVYFSFSLKLLLYLLLSCSIFMWTKFIFG